VSFVLAVQDLHSPVDKPIEGTIRGREDGHDVRVGLIEWEVLTLPRKQNTVRVLVDHQQFRVRRDIEIAVRTLHATSSASYAPGKTTIGGNPRFALSGFARSIQVRQIGSRSPQTITEGTRTGLKTKIP
jgi:hypothetical protein